MIIGISGKINSGKNTVGKIIQYLTCSDCSKNCLELLKSGDNIKGHHNSNWKIKKFASKLKQNALFADYKIEGKINIARSINDVKEVNIDLTNEKHRRLIQGEEIHKNISLIPNWIITDMKFSNELKAVKDRGGISIRINRPKITESNHLNETDLDSAAFDYTIDDNSNIEDLIKKIKKILIKEKIILEV